MVWLNEHFSSKILYYFTFNIGGNLQFNYVPYFISFLKKCWLLDNGRSNPQKDNTETDATQDKPPPKKNPPPNIFKE